MTQVRFDFLNLAPDMEDTENQGLTVAQNVVHDTEGYKPVHLGSAGSFATTGGLAASNATVTSIIAKRMQHSEGFPFFFCCPAMIKLTGHRNCSMEYTVQQGYNEN